MDGRDAIGGLIDARGHIRVPWRPVVDAMQAIGVEEFAARAAALDRRARFESPHGGAAMQRLDPIPVPLMDYEFAELAEAIVERVGFFEDLLDDLYGAQRCIADRSLPGDALFASAEFLRPLARQATVAGGRLGFYAIDLMRHPGGGFRVLRDHTDRAPGLGLALAIRRFVAEVMPELFGAVTLASQRPVIETLQDMLHGLAAGGPIGLLTGPDTDAADARLLARQLGGMVLRPDDLTCAQGSLRLRTLAGSTPVQMLLRLGSSLAIDPLEQGGAPSRGVPGLFHSLRRRDVTMLNAPGSGIMEDAGFKAFYPDLFQRRFDRPMRLAALGGAGPIGFDADQAPIATRLGDAEATARFDFAAVTMRFYALRIDGVWRVLPGGLGHATRADGSVLLKDIWVIDSGEPDRGVAGPAQRVVPRSERRVAMDLPSRLADDLLWLGRMVERLDGAARLLAIALPRFADASNLPHEAAQRAMLAACLIEAKLLPDETSGPFMSARVLNAALARHRPLSELLGEIRRLLDHCGDRFSVSMRGMVEAALDQIPPDESELGVLAACMRFAATFNGVIAEDASRSGGFVFLEIGRRLERGEALAETLAILLDGTPARLDPGLSLAIELADARLSYEFIHAGPISPAPALSLLIGAADYPRSLAFQTEALGVAFERIGAVEEAALARAITASLVTLTRVIGAEIGRLPALATVLQAAAERLHTLESGLIARYFAPLPSAHQIDLTRVYEGQGAGRSPGEP